MDCPIYFMGSIVCVFDLPSYGFALLSQISFLVNYRLRKVSDIFRFWLVLEYYQENVVEHKFIFNNEKYKININPVEKPFFFYNLSDFPHFYLIISDFLMIIYGDILKMF